MLAYRCRMIDLFKYFWDRREITIIGRVSRFRLHARHRICITINIPWFHQLFVETRGWLIYRSFTHPYTTKKSAHHAFYDSIHYKSHAMFFRFTDPHALALALSLSLSRARDKDRNYSCTTLHLKNIYFPIFIFFSTHSKLFDHRYYHFLLVISDGLAFSIAWQFAFTEQGMVLKREKKEKMMNSLREIRWKEKKRNVRNVNEREVESRWNGQARSK